MDGYNDKRSGGRFGITGRKSGIAFRDASSHDERNVHCNRMVCSNRLNIIKNPQASNSEGDKSSSSFRTTGKATVGSSSKVYSTVTSYRKVSVESQDPSSVKGTLSAETNDIQSEKMNSGPSFSPTRAQVRIPATRDAESGVQDGPVNGFNDMESYTHVRRTQTQKQIHRHSGHGNQETSVGSSSRRLSAPRNTGQALKPAFTGQSFITTRSSSSLPHTNRHGLRNLGCTSISDVFHRGSSSSDSSQDGKGEMVKRKSLDREYSSAKGKNAITSTSAVNSGSHKNSLSGRNLSLLEHPSQPTSRRTRYWLPSKNGVTSVRTRRTTNDDRKSRVSESDSSMSPSSPSEPSVVIPEVYYTDVSISESSPSYSQQIVAELPAMTQNSSIQPTGRNENVRNSPNAHRHGGARQFSLSIERDGYRRYNRDGIAEVLQALERIEQDEELTYEQILILETNLFLSGLGFRDQHRDMRLDIDNMSYEELLALGEKMGTVSTGLTEEPPRVTRQTPTFLFFLLLPHTHLTLRSDAMSSDSKSRLQKRAPPSIQVEPASSYASDWKVAIPLLSPLILSPASPPPQKERTAEIHPSSSSKQDVQMKDKPIFKLWQHPAAPFHYEAPPPFVQSFVPRCR